MSYCMKLREASFRIPKENFTDVCDALKFLCGENKRLEYVDNANVIQACEQGDIKSAFSYLRWNISQDENGITDIKFNASRLGDEETIFCSIARFVEPDSFIEVMGEDMLIWHWYFDGECCFEQNGSYYL